VYLQQLTRPSKRNGRSILSATALDDTPIPVTARPLSIEERSILARLLDFDFPGSEALRAQVPFVSVVGVCPCGCVSRELEVDRSQVPPASGVASPIPGEAEVPARSGDNGGGIIAFAKDGYLSSLEAYSHDVEPIRCWPPMDVLVFRARG
jgi:hypothetical protein